MNKTLTAILLATLTVLPSTAQAGLWRMYKCVGDQGEPVFTDRQSTWKDCREMWITGTDSGGVMITEGMVKIADSPGDFKQSEEIGPKPLELVPGEIR